MDAGTVVLAEKSILAVLRSSCVIVMESTQSGDSSHAAIPQRHSCTVLGGNRVPLRDALMRALVVEVPHVLP
jgi:hypothetical protein